MKRVLIIYTGGTIGMTRTENGYAPQSGQFRRAMEAIPDLYAEQMPRWDMLEMDPLLDSSNMTVHEWNKIAQLVADHYDAYDGFVVLHGTDTMAYTASALSFMLEGLAKPVILTGSQIPMCEIRSDGRDNLITSLLIAGAGEVHEVCLYFGGKLLRGNRATKFSADGLIAFLSPNYPSLADAGITIRYNESALLPKPKGALKLQLLENIPIGVLKVFPGIQFSLFEQIMTERLRGIVIETLALFHRRLHLPVRFLRQTLAHDCIVKYHGSKNVRDLFHLAWSPFCISKIGVNNKKRHWCPEILSSPRRHCRFNVAKYTPVAEKCQAGRAQFLSADFTEFSANLLVFLSLTRANAVVYYIHGF